MTARLPTARGLQWRGPAWAGPRAIGSPRHSGGTVWALHPASLRQRRVVGRQDSTRAAVAASRADLPFVGMTPTTAASSRRAAVGSVLAGLQIGLGTYAPGAHRRRRCPCPAMIAPQCGPDDAITVTCPAGVLGHGAAAVPSVSGRTSSRGRASYRQGSPEGLGGPGDSPSVAGRGPFRITFPFRASGGRRAAGLLTPSTRSA
jgi:hypothetical protein